MSQDTTRRTMPKALNDYPCDAGCGETFKEGSYYVNITITHRSEISGRHYNSSVRRELRTCPGNAVNWELDLLMAPEPKPYKYNPEKGTVYAYTAPYKHRDFGRVVELPNGNWMAIPNRPVREFATEQEAVEWLV